MKEKILILITGTLIGAALASAGFLVHSKTNNTNTLGNIPQMNQSQMQNDNRGMTPPSIGQGQNNIPSPNGHTNNNNTDNNKPQMPNNGEKPNMNENTLQNNNTPANRPQGENIQNRRPQGNGGPQGRNGQNKDSRPNIPGGNNSQNVNGNTPSAPSENSEQ